MLQTLCASLLLLGLASVAPFSMAAPAVALGYTPKYPPDFSHFDYVNPAATQGGTLLLSAYGHFDSLNPFLLKGEEASGLNEMVFETLMVRSLDEPFSVYGLLAEDLALADDGLAATFRLNPKARFSNGTAVTAEDVQFSFTQLTSKAAHPQYRLLWTDIKAAIVLDQQRIRFEFSRISPELPLLLASRLPIFSQAAMGDQALTDFVTTPLTGSGPYLIADFQVGRFIRYQKNANYWGAELNTRRGMFNFEQVILKYYKDFEIMLEALKSGEFDFMTVYNSKQWARNFTGPQFDRGQLLKQELAHHNNAGMQSFIFNLRRPLFQDKRVRQAMNLAFDFDWSNKNLFYEQYQRCNSYFTNSELAAIAGGLPSTEELALLTPFKATLAPEIFNTVWRPVTSPTPALLRKNLIAAKKLLLAAGWQVRDGILYNAAGKPFQFEVLLSQKGFERILAPYAHNLAKLGIKMTYRTLDVALYMQRREQFDFDMTVAIFPQNQTPGNELRNMWHSEAADQPGSLNLIGLKNPVIDSLIEAVSTAKNRAELITATRALDRVLLHDEYVIPNWFSPVHRVSYWDKFAKPETLPLYYQVSDWMLQTWWFKK